MKNSFAGITALVTGASYGIGEHFARELAREGAHLILVARSKNKLEALAAELKQAYGVQIHVFEADLSFHETPRRLFEILQKERLSVDLLINNAGFGRSGYFEDATAEKDNEMLLVNINSLVALTHLFLPDMLVKGSGGIINVASTAAFQPLPHLSLYSATKAFVLHFTEALWGEYKDRGVRILCLCPGNTITEFHHRAGIQKRRVVFISKAPDVAKFALNVYQNTNHPTAIYGLMNWLMAQGHRFLPREWLIRIICKLYHPQSY